MPQFKADPLPIIPETGIAKNKEIQRLITLEMMKLSEKEAVFVNPLTGWTREDLENPGVSILRYMRKPENFYFTCKHLLNVKLLPFQQVILNELWYRTFPMLIASRGAGKCIDGNAYVVTNYGFSRIEKVVGDITPHVPNYPDNLFLLGREGFNAVEYCWNNGYGPVKKIRMSTGIKIDVTPNHPMRVVRDGEVVWVEGEQIRVGDYLPVDRSEVWFPNTNDISPDVAYAFGLLVGDGGYSKKERIGFTTADESLAEALSMVARKLWGKPFKKSRAKYQYDLYSREARESLFSDYGFVGEKSGDKDFPNCILSAPRDSVAAFIRGLMDTDGSATRRRLGVEFASKSQRLVETLQFVFTRFGIISKVRTRRNCKYNRDYYYLYITGRDAALFAERIGFGLERKRAILRGYLTGLIHNTNKDTLPSCLVLSDLLSLRDRWSDVRPSTGHEYHYGRQLMSASRLKAYDISYNTLDRVLGETDSLSYTSEWQRLHSLRESHYFYDRVVSIENGECTTFDVHMKNDHDRSFVSNGLISHNSWLLGVYALLRALFIQGRKVVITGAGFRQAKIIMGYIENMWFNSPILRSLVSENSRSGPHHDADKWEMRLGDSTITALPLGDGSKIRGYRAHDIIADEFASIPREIFETVVAGFGVVELQPYEKVERAAEISVYKKMGLWTQQMEELERKRRVGNQSIISGTAYYQFNHFAEYWKRWHGFITSNGDPAKIKNLTGSEPEPGFDYRDYCVIRLPVNLLPAGYMDERHIARSKQTVHSGVYLNEFGAVFSSDSNGFFKRSLIESCVTNVPINVGGEYVQFRCVVRGNPNFKYVYGVDPASETDKFSIVVLELHETHQRVVYCWTFDKAEHTKRIANSDDAERDFYAYCARKIRNLMRVFPCEHIALDSQGGGVSIREALHDPDKLKPDEKPIWEITAHHPLSDGKERPTDHMAGLHILELCNFAKADYTAQANHGLRKDFEDKVCLFPMTNAEMTAALAVSMEHDFHAKREFDTLDDCFQEIEELKEELATIVHTQTPGTNRDHWDTPELKLAGSKRGRLRKDRYSSLVMANYAARRMQRQVETPPYENFGGFVGQIKKGRNGPAYVSGPDWFVNPKNVTHGSFGTIIRRGGVK